MSVGDDFIQRTRQPRGLFYRAVAIAIWTLVIIGSVYYGIEAAR